LPPTAANALSSASVRRNDQLDRVVEAGTTGATMDVIDAIDGCRIRGGRLPIGIDALCKVQ
jgi:hypothetical protein